MGLIVDNFAGGGGASLGIEMALGRSVDIAVNHDRKAIEMHEANHPQTLHLQEDVFKVSPRKVCAGQGVDLAWFSPDCTHHSNAKGGKPLSRKRRGLAGVAVRWARDVRPRVIVVENVPEFESWGPLDKATGRPDPLKAGTSFRRWLYRLTGMGYRVEWKKLIAAEYGAPTTRKRLFVVARCDDQPIIWPAVTHHPLHWFRAGMLPQVPIHKILDLDLPMKPLAKLCENTRNAILKEQRRLQFSGIEPFVMSYYGNPGFRGIYTQVLATVTVRDRFSFVDGEGYRMLQPRELARAQGFPDSYLLTGTKTSQVARIGNSVCPPVAAALVRANCSFAMRGEAVA